MLRIYIFFIKFTKSVDIKKVKTVENLQDCGFELSACEDSDRGDGRVFARCECRRISLHFFCKNMGCVHA